MKLYAQPLEKQASKFVITEERAYFVPSASREQALKMIEILWRIFDLNDPEIYREVDNQLSEGWIILGHYDPSTKEVDVHVPLETSDYVERRIEEVFVQ